LIFFSDAGQLQIDFSKFFHVLKYFNSLGEIDCFYKFK